MISYAVGSHETEVRSCEKMAASLLFIILKEDHNDLLFSQYLPVIYYVQMRHTPFSGLSLLTVLFSLLNLVISQQIALTRYAEILPPRATVQRTPEKASQAF